MIVLITPTGGRPDQFKLCMWWMHRQTYKGKVCWIVVDDCEPLTTNGLSGDFRENWSIVKKYPEPIWKVGDNTQGRNLRVGINIAKAFPKDQVEAIFVIEDDDYYKPEYLQEMVERLKGFDVAGELLTVYYNIPRKRYKVHTNTKHSSLFQTCFVPSAIPVFESCLKEQWIDVEFFKKMTAGYKVNLFQGCKLAIGIKGLPGRAGIGTGHVMSGPRDMDLNKVKMYLGDDYKYYM